SVTIDAINDAPVNTVPGPQNILEDTSLVFSAAGGNALSVSDVDADPNAVQVTLAATNGALTLSQTSGLTFTTGHGTADTAMVFTGTIASVNAALSGLTFAPKHDFNGTASL